MKALIDGCFGTMFGLKCGDILRDNISIMVTVDNFMNTDMFKVFSAKHAWFAINELFMLINTDNNKCEFFISFVKSVYCGEGFEWREFRHE